MPHIISPPLERLVQQESLAEMFALLEPEEVLIAILRLEGLADCQIADVLNLSRWAVGRRMDRARARIAAALPELAVVLRDRCQPSREPTHLAMPTPDRGWLYDWGSDEEAVADTSPDPDPDLTAVEVAHLYRVNRRTVLRWIHAGHFPHAYPLDGDGGEYRIPASDLESTDL